MVHPALYSSERHNWQTPQWLLDCVGPIALDPCTSSDNPTNALQFFTKEHDGLTLPWDVVGTVWVNPPYGREIGKWVTKCRESYYPRCGRAIHLLVPARPDTLWWDDALQGGPQVTFFRGRLKFKGAESSAPFPSALFTWADRRCLLPRSWTVPREHIIRL